RVGYLPQGMVIDPRETLGAFIQNAEGDPDGLSRRLEALATELASQPERRDLQDKYDSVLQQLALVAESAGRGPAVLAGLGLGHFDLDTPTGNLSGGQRTRLALAGALLASPQLLLLDEPTNHLDLDMLAWLEEWLVAFRGGALVVSHDRAFLDRVATGILEMDGAALTLRAYPGNYSDYLDQKQAEWEHGWQAYKDQQDEIGRLRESSAHLRGIAKFRKGGKADSGDKFARGFFANRSLATVGRAKHIEARLEKLLTEDRVDKPRPSWQMKVDFGEGPESGRDVIVLEDLTVGYGDLVLIREANQRVRYGARVVLVGPNGAGKTSLIKTILGEVPPLGGKARLGTNVRVGYMAQQQEQLDPSLTPLTTIQATAPVNETEARWFLAMYLFKGDDVFTPVGKLSYGERARLALACMAAQGCNLLILDEPVNHLDIPSRAQFEQALTNFEGTVFAVVHDRYFIAAVATEVWEVRDGRLSANFADESNPSADFVDFSEDIRE
ncbi:MAG TPA: ABC-F family ATP-binding cassette domain-containing protein, partial [Anaerolineaceae bacterium]|nr:ABC-F family ATP-binding cassette domain-containing protein [Anaerolineaceae bacterium]